MALGIPRNQERSLEDGLFEALNMLSNMFLETGSRYFWQTLVEEHLSAKFQRSSKCSWHFHRSALPVIRHSDIPKDLNLQ